MIQLKTAAEIALMQESATLLGKAHGEVAKLVRPGVQTKALDKVAEEFIRDNGATPSFLNYNGFPASLCMSVNEVVVHGFPSNYTLKDGDIVSIDCGVKLNGYHADSAYTYPIGEVAPETLELLKHTKASLYLGIEQARAGNRIGDIGYAIQKYCEARKYTVVRELVGHGLGRRLHEKPEVPNYGKKGKGPLIKNGLVIAIEPMINLGSKRVVQEADGWTIRTRDRRPSAHFEHTVAVVGGEPKVLTTFEYIEQAFKYAHA